MAISHRIKTCPQHAPKTNVKLKYLLRTCPECMMYLGRHPEAAKIVVMKIPAAYPIPRADLASST